LSQNARSVLAHIRGRTRWKDQLRTQNEAARKPQNVFPNHYKKRHPLPDGSALLLAIEEWLTPSGNLIWHKGITPNVVVALAPGSSPAFPETERTMSVKELQDSGDAQLLRAWKCFADMSAILAGQLVQGVDVWINTPRRPWEACGTSGMKVLVNGGINLSELDGWWAEAYTPEVGWVLGDGKEHGDDPAWDAAEAEALYHILERGDPGVLYPRQ